MTAGTIAPLVDADVSLRMLESTDLPATLAWRNHADSRAWFHSTDPITETQHRDWFARYLERDDDYVFVLDAGGVPVAQVSLYDIADGSAEFGRLLVDPAARGRGLSHRAIALCLRVADEVLLLERVHLEVKRDNVRAIRGYEVAGFRADDTRTGTHDSLVMERARP
jgi:RimJ/RimL family protein N-acetyltransferase